MQSNPFEFSSGKTPIYMAARLRPEPSRETARSPPREPYRRLRRAGRNSFQRVGIPFKGRVKSRLVPGGSHPNRSPPCYPSRCLFFRILHENRFCRRKKGGGLMSFRGLLLTLFLLTG